MLPVWKWYVCVAAAFVCLCKCGCSTNSIDKDEGAGKSISKEAMAEHKEKVFKHDFGRITAGDAVTKVFEVDLDRDGDSWGLEKSETSCSCVVAKIEFAENGQKQLVRVPISWSTSGDKEVGFCCKENRFTTTAKVTLRSGSQKRELMFVLSAIVGPSVSANPPDLDETNESCTFQIKREFLDVDRFNGILLSASEGLKVLIEGRSDNAIDIRAEISDIATLRRPVVLIQGTPEPCELIVPFGAKRVTVLPNIAFATLSDKHVQLEFFLTSQEKFSVTAAFENSALRVERPTTDTVRLFIPTAWIEGKTDLVAIQLQFVFEDGSVEKVNRPVRIERI